jgi:small subunit ribosomal protein S6
MINYETLMLARTEITDDELRALERSFDKFVTDQKGKVSVFDKWGKYKLAYPVQKNVYGIYILARYQVDEKADLKGFFKEIDLLFRIKYNELIMRHVTVRIDGEISLVYKYPEPINSHGGTSNLDSFIKENKMEGLIDTPVEKKKEISEDKPEESVKETVEKKPVEAATEVEKLEGDKDVEV